MPTRDEFDQKIQFYDKLLKPLVIFVMVYVLIGMTIGVRQIFIVGGRIEENTQQIQSIINNNQKSTLEARGANVQRQVELKNYIKCILLIRYDNPNLTATSPRADTELALDRCAKVQ